jgi:DNA-directed RNA polymerase subunit K/omega
MPTTIEKLVLIEKITARIANRYEAVRVMAKEARRLNSLIVRGARADADFKPTSAALNRVIEDKVKYEYVERDDTLDEMFTEDGK